MRRLRNNSAEKILATATHLFAANGFEKTSIREVCKAAGISRPVVYYFYRNKEGLFRTVMDKAGQHFRDQILAAMESHSDFRQRCVRLTDLLCQDAIKHPHMWRLLLGSLWPVSDHAHAEVAIIRESLVRLLILEELGSSDRHDKRVQAAAYIYAGTMSFIIARYLNTGQPDIISLPAESIVNLLFDGFASARPQTTKSRPRTRTGKRGT